MADSEQVQSPLVQAIEEVGRWREGQEQEARARLDEIRLEQERLEADIEALRRQIAELAELRAEVDADLGALPALETARTRAAVETGLDAEAELLVDLEPIYSDALKAREDRVAALLAQPDVARLVTEFEQFQALEPTLANLPPGYRDAILAHHGTVRERLAPVVEASRAPLAVAERDATSITVVASLNPSEGEAEALVLILPLAFEVYEEWSERSEDLRAVLAYRVIAAVGAALEEVGVPDAAMQFADYRGLLAVQVWFGAETPAGDVREALSHEIERLSEEAVELLAVRLELYTAWLDPKVVTGEADDQDETIPDEPTSHDVSAPDEATPAAGLEA